MPAGAASSQSSPEPTPPTASLIGQTLRGTYRILESLDQGGMGIVFRAEHVRLRRRVAVKVLAEHLAADANALIRFQREADIVSRLVHPHIVQILDFDTTESGAPYIVMELLHGESLSDSLLRLGRIELAEGVRIAWQVASALASAHAAGIVHRDLKPANIFLVNVPGQPSFVKLLDFGISKSANSSGVTGEFDILGTPDYMAPEQALGSTAFVDHRADQFSLAAITQELLSGEPPFAAADVSSVLSRVINDEPTALSNYRLTIPDEVGPVLRRALSKRPDDRYSNILEFVTALARAAACTVGMTPLASGSGHARPKATARESESASTLIDARTGSKSSSSIAAGAQGPHLRQPRTEDLRGEVKVTIERARQAVGFEDFDLALRYAESALSLVEHNPDPEAARSLERAETLFSLIYERFLGNRGRTIAVLKHPSSSSATSISPVEVFLISRLDGITLEEALDISPLARPATLRLLVRLLQTQAIELEE